MERDEMIRYIEFLLAEKDEQKRAREAADARVMELLARIDRMGAEHQEQLRRLEETIENLTSALRLGRKNRFATTSQKSRPSSCKKETLSR